MTEKTPDERVDELWTILDTALRIYTMRPKPSFLDGSVKLATAVFLLAATALTAGFAVYTWLEFIIPKL